MKNLYAIWVILMISFDIHWFVNLKHEWLRSLKFGYKGILEKFVSFIVWLFIIIPIIFLILNMVET